jgi:hypothetical protein
MKKKKYTVRDFVQDCGFFLLVAYALKYTFELLADPSAFLIDLSYTARTQSIFVPLAKIAILTGGWVWIIRWWKK